MPEEEARVVLSENAEGKFVLAGGYMYWEGNGTPGGAKLMGELGASAWTAGMVTIGIQAIYVVAGLAYDGCGTASIGYALSAAEGLMTANPVEYGAAINGLAGCVYDGWQEQRNGGGGGDLYYE